VLYLALEDGPAPVADALTEHHARPTSTRRNPLHYAVDAVPGASLVVVHHTRNTESSDFIDSVSGSWPKARLRRRVLVFHLA
jgi:hypothetical protein